MTKKHKKGRQQFHACMLLFEVTSTVQSLHEAIKVTV